MGAISFVATLSQTKSDPTIYPPANE